jgi:hypothetical protein
VGYAVDHRWRFIADVVRGPRQSPKGSLAQGATAIPDDSVDRALHASILDIESRRKWLWLENLTGS